MTTPTAVVVGAGPIGLAASVEMARRGWQVRVFEARQPPFDKACGEGLMPDGKARLEALGVATAGEPLGGICYRAPGLLVDAPFPGPPGRGIRRPELHRALVERAVALGVDIAWGVRITEAGRDGTVEWAHGHERAKVVVVADGLRSSLRTAAGLARPGRGHQRFGVRAHFRLAPRNDRVEVWWGDDGAGGGAEAYVTPVGPEEIGVALLTSRTPVRYHELLARFPVLASRLAGVAQTGPVMGVGPLEQRVSRRIAGRLVLVGDAAGYLDAITGEGLSLGLHQAAILGECLDHGRLGAYDRQVRRITNRADRFARLWLLTQRRPRLRRQALLALARHPGLFARLLAVHVGARPPVAGDLLLLLLALMRSRE